MPEYVTPAGLQIPTIADLDAAIVADQRAAIDPNIDTDPDSPTGAINGIFESHLREAWEVIAIAYNGYDPDAAEDFTLDSLCSLTGTSRAPATPSTFAGTKSIQLTLSANTTVPGSDGVPGNGTAFTQANNPSVRFTLDNDVVSTTAGVYTGTATCTVTGPVNCNAGTLTVIATPVTGLLAVTNPLDVLLGTNQDTNYQLRLRREEDLRAEGKGTLDSIRAEVYAITLPDGNEPIINVHMYENQLIVNDPITNNPGKSVEVLIYDGIGMACPNEVIAQTLWDCKPAGIQYVGNTTAMAIDGLGNTQVIPFSRPTLSAVQMAITIQVNAVTYPGDQAALTELINYFQQVVLPASTIRWTDYVTALKGYVENEDGTVSQNVPGVIDISAIQLGFVGGSLLPVFTNLVLGLRQQGTLDTSNISLTSVPV